jgi:MazG family protein
MPHLIPTSEQPPIERLRAIMHILRAPGGCPWDAEQTHESLAPHLIEEAYEVAAAIRSGWRDELVDELGDVLLQPIFHAEIASETGAFDFDDVARAICEKLIRRHPHVFGDTTALDPEAVLSQWEKIKITEKSSKTGETSMTLSHSLLKNANDGLPALMAAQKIQKKVAKVGFDWPEIAPVVEKIREEITEVEEALASGDSKAIAEEIGDLLFAVVNLARKTKQEAELLLDAANRKFIDRFQKVEASLSCQGLSLEEATLEQMDQAWNATKAASS